MSADPQAWAALMVAASAVGGFGWTIRNGIRKDRRERESEHKKDTQALIDAAIRAEREHQKVLDVEAENAELRKKLRGSQP